MFQNFRGRSADPTVNPNAFTRRHICISGSPTWEKLSTRQHIAAGAEPDLSTRPFWEKPISANQNTHKKTKAPIATIAVYVTPCDRKERGANPNWRQLRSPESPVSIKKWRLKTCLFCKQNSWNTRPRCHFVVRKKKHREKITAIRE